MNFEIGKLYRYFILGDGRPYLFLGHPTKEEFVQYKNKYAPKVFGSSVQEVKNPFKQVFESLYENNATYKFLFNNEILIVLEQEIYLNNIEEIHC